MFLFFLGYGIRCTTGGKFFVESQVITIPGQAIQSVMCPSDTDTCFTVKYSVTHQGESGSVILGLCVSDPSETCKSESFCKSVTQIVPSSDSSNCKVSSENKIILFMAILKYFIMNIRLPSK